MEERIIAEKKSYKKRRGKEGVKKKGKEKRRREPGTSWPPRPDVIPKP